MVKQERLTTESQKVSIRKKGKDKMNINKMIDKVIFKFGFESEISLEFYKVIDKGNKREIIKEYTRIMNTKY